MNINNTPQVLSIFFLNSSFPDLNPKIAEVYEKFYKIEDNSVTLACWMPLTNMNLKQYNAKKKLL